MTIGTLDEISMTAAATGKHDQGIALSPNTKRFAAKEDGATEPFGVDPQGMTRTSAMQDTFDSVHISWVLL